MQYMSREQVDRQNLPQYKIDELDTKEQASYDRLTAVMSMPGMTPAELAADREQKAAHEVWLAEKWRKDARIQYLLERIHIEREIIRSHSAQLKIHEVELKRERGE